MNVSPPDGASVSAVPWSVCVAASVWSGLGACAPAPAVPAPVSAGAGSPSGPGVGGRAAVGAFAGGAVSTGSLSNQYWKL